MITPGRHSARRIKLSALVAAFLVLLSGRAIPSLAEPGPAMVDRIEEARRLARDGRAREAVEVLDAVVASTPSAGDRALFQKGLILFSRLKDHESAVSTFEDVVRLYPDSPLGDDALYYAGFVAQFHLRDTARAVRLYQAGYDAYPQGDYRFSIADKLRELTGLAPGQPLPDSAEPRPGTRPAPEGISVSTRGDAGTPASSRRTPPETDVPDTSPFRPRGARTLTVQFEKAPLRTFIQWVAQVTGRNFIIDDDVQGEITVYSGTQVPFAEIYRIFLSILEVKGFAAVESGNVTKIVSRQQAASSELPIILDDDAYVPTDRMVTRIFRLKTVAANAVQGLLRPFLLSTDQLLVSPESNNLIATGPGANIARIAELVALLDNERTPLRVETHVVRHARAATLADKLAAIIAGLSPAGVTPPPFKVVADERTNSIYILTDEETHRRTSALILQLDVDRLADRIVKVYALSYAKAEEAARQLKALLGLDAADAAPDFGGVTQTVILPDLRLNALMLSTFAARVVDQVDSYVANVDRPPSDSLRTMKIVRLQNAQATKLAETLSKMFGASSSATGSASTTPATDAGASGLADRVVISADERINALLVTCTPVDWMKLEPVIRDLDVRKTQVLIDAVVLETNLDEARSLGASIMSAEQPRDGQTVGFARSDPVGFLPTYQALAAQGGLTIGAMRGSIVAAMLNALLTSSRTNVLQMPQILALDNEIATLSVGNLTPIVTSRSVSGDNVQIGGTSSIFQNVEYRNIGLNVKLKPHIGDRGDILIESRIEIQNRNLQAEAGLNLPVFTTREIEQKFQIQTGDYIVLGGLLRTQDDYVQRETPWLARIPILGSLFKSSRTTESKTVLLIFLRPRIVTDPGVARDISAEERSQFEAESSTRPGAVVTEADKWIPPRP